MSGGERDLRVLTKICMAVDVSVVLLWSVCSVCASVVGWVVEWNVGESEEGRRGLGLIWEAGVGGKLRL
jgi:hypothetical protein